MGLFNNSFVHFLIEFFSFQRNRYLAYPWIFWEIFYIFYTFGVTIFLMVIWDGVRKVYITSFNSFSEYVLFITITV